MDSFNNQLEVLPDLLTGYNGKEEDPLPACEGLRV